MAHDGCECSAPGLPGGRFTRRNFISGAGASFLGFAAAAQARAFGAPSLELLLPQDTVTATAKACIVVWLAGGPSHIDTFDPKPGAETGGPTKAIPTTADGIEIAEHLPIVASQMKHASLIRTMTSKEGSHERARYLMHTGYAPTGTVVHPSMGAVAAMEVGSKAMELPNFIAISSPTEGAGFLPPDYSPFVVDNPVPGADGKVQIRNLAPVNNDDRRFRERMKLLAEQEKEFVKDRASEETDKHKAAYEKADKLMHTPLLKAFQLGDEKAELRKAYGESRFGQGCLLARRLVEVGVKFVEVGLGGWDTHEDIFERMPTLCGTLDPGLGTLLKDLADRKLLDSTLVLCLGEFGRTPRINAERNGRDHFPRVFSALIAGGGVKGGRVIGSTGTKGDEVAKGPPVSVGDLMATVYSCLGVDIKKEIISPLGRPLKFVDSGAPVKDLLN